MRDFTIETFLLIGGTLVVGFFGLFVFGAGIPALVGAIVGFVLTVFFISRGAP